MKINIFFDGEEIKFPAQNEWEQFEGVDSARLFYIVATRWKDMGFDPVRFTSKCSLDALPLWRDNGRVSESFHWYPSQRWNLIPKIAMMDCDMEEVMIFSSLDVLPVRPDLFFSMPHKALNPSFWNFQRGHISLGLFACNRHWAMRAARILVEYDSEILPRISGSYISDETIIRRYMPGFHYDLDSMYFPIDPEARRRDAHFLHLSRSSMREAYNSIPMI